MLTLTLDLWSSSSFVNVSIVHWVCSVTCDALWACLSMILCKCCVCCVRVYTAWSCCSCRSSRDNSIYIFKYICRCIQVHISYKSAYIKKCKMYNIRVITLTFSISLACVIAASSFSWSTYICRFSSRSTSSLQPSNCMYNNTYCSVYIKQYVSTRGNTNIHTYTHS